MKNKLLIFGIGILIVCLLCPLASAGPFQIITLKPLATLNPGLFLTLLPLNTPSVQVTQLPGLQTLNLPGQLSAFSTPTGANIYVDGAYKGKTPKTISLTKGSHLVILTYPGYSDYTQTVNIQSLQVTFLNAALQGGQVQTQAVTPTQIVTQTQLPSTQSWPNTGFGGQGVSTSISSNPSGAAVFIDGWQIGVTPGLFTIASGSHQIRLTKPGYQDLSTTINIGGFNPWYYTYTLTPVPQTVTAASATPTPTVTSTATATIQVLPSGILMPLTLRTFFPPLTLPLHTATATSTSTSTPTPTVTATASASASPTVTTTSSGSASCPSAPSGGTKEQQIAYWVFKYTNDARISAGLAPYCWYQDLAPVATQYSQTLAASGSASSHDLNGPWQNRFNGIPNSLSGENIAFTITGVNVYNNPTTSPACTLYPGTRMIQDTPEAIGKDLVDSWVLRDGCASPPNGHKNNILSSNFNKIGIGVATGSVQDTGGNSHPAYFATQDFIRQP